MPIFNPPLLGDGHGIYRIHLVGNCGTGKTTLGAYLSERLNIPHISLDGIAWQPGWQAISADEFKQKVDALMAQNTQGWIIDGNHLKLLGTMVRDNATDIIWLDAPLLYYLPRLLWRTLMRVLGLGDPCAEGCKETWGNVFSKQGIVWWCITNHPVARTNFTAWLLQMSAEDEGKMRRLDESKGELTKWKDQLEEHYRQI